MTSADWVLAGPPQLPSGIGRPDLPGARIELRIDPSLLHMGQLWAPWWDVACASLDRAMGFALSVGDQSSGGLGVNSSS